MGRDLVPAVDCFALITAGGRAFREWPCEGLSLSLPLAVFAELEGAGVGLFPGSREDLRGGSTSILGVGISSSVWL